MIHSFLSFLEFPGLTSMSSAMVSMCLKKAWGGRGQVICQVTYLLTTLKKTASYWQLKQTDKGDYWQHFNYCNTIAIGHMDIAILLWYCNYYCNSIAIVFRNVVLNALHFKKCLRSSGQYRYWGTQWMARLYWWFKNQDAKNARCSRWIVFSFFFTFLWPWKSNLVSLFSKEVKMLEV